MKPIKQMVTREQMQAVIDGGKHLVTRKYDGEFCEHSIGNVTLLCECVRQRSGAFLTASDRAALKRHGGRFYVALTVASVGGVSVLDKPADWRWSMLQDLARRSQLPGIVMPETVSSVEAAFAAGAEGVCAVPWDSLWCFMLCVKQNIIVQCRVTGFVAGTQSVTIEDAETKQDLGKIALRGGKCDQVKIGSIIRVDATGKTDSGKLRQPNPCSDWLLKL